MQFPFEMVHLQGLCCLVKAVCQGERQDYDYDYDDDHKKTLIY